MNRIAVHSLLVVSALLVVGKDSRSLETAKTVDRRTSSRQASNEALPPAAQAATTPRIARTPDGRPDFQGMWLNDTATPLERPIAFAAKPFFTEQEAREFEKNYLVAGLTERVPPDQREFVVNATQPDIDTFEPGRVLPDLRTSLIVDPPSGRVPELTPDARLRQAERAKRQNSNAPDHPENLSNGERCLSTFSTAVPPLLPIFYNNHLQIVQTAEHLALASEMIHDARIVSFRRRTHLAPSIRQWTGDSLGHWEGDTLIVDTTNFTDKSPFRGSGQNLRVIERLRMLNPDRIEYEFTVIDPESFTQPWTARSEFRRTESQMFEYACHEGNVSMVNMLRGARAADQR